MKKKKSSHKIKAFVYNGINEALKNYRHVNSNRVFFPGCSFMSYFPNTTNEISIKLKEDFGISTVYDCCTKNVALLKDKNEFVSCMGKVNKRFEDNDITEVIVLCPNCYHHLSRLEGIKVSMIYEHEDIMKSLIIPEEMEKIEGYLFVPCPDKASRDIYKHVVKYIDIDKLEELDRIYCCGAGLRDKTKEKLQKIGDKFAKCDKTIYVYCASCRGVIFKSNNNVKHIMCALMGSDEKVNPGIDSFKNRVKCAII